jgi:peptide/nickel transport system permease protein
MTFAQSLRRLRPAEAVPLVLLIGIFAAALIGPILVGADPTIRIGRPFLPPSALYLLGTDDIGRDMLSRVTYGVRLTWLLSLMIIATALVIGATVGAIGAMAGGWLDAALSRLTDLFMVIPSTLIAMAAVAALGPGLWHTVGTMTIFWWPWYARIARSELRAVAGRPYFEAARMARVRGLRLMLRYMLPAAWPSLLVTATLDVANVILVLSLFSFLGLGAPAPTPELGAMTARSLIDLTTHPWIPLIPALAVFILVFVSNLCGDALRNRLDAV